MQNSLDRQNFSIVNALGLLVHFQRCHFTIHQSECLEKDFQKHLEVAASSHAVFHQEEIQQLRCTLKFKVQKP